MDELKDISGQNLNRDITGFGKDMNVNPFGRNTSSAKAYSRAERIVAAVYLVTRNVSDSDILKRTVRETSYELTKVAMRLSGGFRSEDHPVVQELSIIARELITTMRLLVVSGYVSAQNANLIITAVDELVVLVQGAQHSLLSERLVLSRNDLIPDEHTEQKQAHRAPSHSIMQRGAGIVRRASSDRSGGEDHRARREAILALLKQNGALGIKDIASHIVGCSEKTVQRELSALTTSGQIAKQGEKRWSRYILAKK